MQSPITQYSPEALQSKPRFTQTRPQTSDIGIYDCEVRLHFRLIENQQSIEDQEGLLELLLEAFCEGKETYVDPIEVSVSTSRIDESNAPSTLRRQLLKLRNMGLSTR